MILFSFIETRKIHAFVARRIITLNHLVLMKDLGAAYPLKIIALVETYTTVFDTVPL